MDEERSYKEINKAVMLWFLYHRDPKGDLASFFKMTETEIRKFARNAPSVFKLLADQTKNSEK